MTKKRKRYPDLNQKLERPWCYYCERDFDDLKILISHQKAKHFKCDRCGRRLNTAGGLSVHMNQVHKETLTHVENATAGRQNLDIEIFGMEGVPPEIIEQHNQAVTEKHFAEQAERQRLTGNPVQGTGVNGEEGVKSKRPRVHETVEEIEIKAEKWRQDRRNGIARPVKSEVVPVPTPPAPTPAAHFAPPSAAAVPPFASNGVPSFPPPVGLPGVPPPFAPPGQFGAPPPGLAPLPTRPTSNPPPAADLSNQIDNLIAEAAAPEKKEKKKGKDIKLVFYDENISPEEKMAALPRYGEFMRA